MALAMMIQPCQACNPYVIGDKKISYAKDTMPLKDFLFTDNRSFLQCHASTIISLRNGRYMVAWFGGTAEKNDDVGIWMTTGKPGHWQQPVQIAKINNEPHWNPVLFQSPQGVIWLFFKVGKEIPSWVTWVKTSDDGGTTWSEPRELVAGDAGGRGPVRNKMITLTDGSWLAGSSHEDGSWNVFFDRSDDNGNSWLATPHIPLNRKEIKGKGVIQPTLWQSAPGHVHALLRSSSGVICRTDSKDNGLHWSPVYKTSLPNPNSGIDLIKLKDGTLLLAYNPDEKDWGSRGRLALAISGDNGTTWPKRIMIENGNKKEEYSYPAIIAEGDTVTVTYTWNRERIAFWSASKKWILAHAVPYEN